MLEAENPKDHSGFQHGIEAAIEIIKQVPETLFNNAIELPSEPNNRGWEAMYWEMAKARTSSVKEVQELKDKLAKIKAIAEH
jgi:hypothetical protein